MRLFLYGTLLHPKTLARRGGAPGLAHRLIVAILSGWRRVELIGTAYPTLRKDPAAHVIGGCVDIGPASLRRLTAYEGPRYHLRRVVVVTPKGKTAAWTWIAAGAGTRPWFGMRPWKGGTDDAATPGPTRHTRG